jgi:hypothetical protein
MVASAFEDDRALGKRLYIHGPEGITLPDALERFFRGCHPDLKVVRLKLWQAREPVDRFLRSGWRVGRSGRSERPRWSALNHVERVDRESKE